MRTARFHELRDRAVAAVDRTFAEPIRVRPRLEGNQYRPDGPDPARATFEIEGVLRIGSGSEDLGGEGSKTWSTMITNGKAVLAVDSVVWPAARSIRSGDIVKALSRPGEPEFAVEQPNPRDVARLSFILVLA